MTIPELFTKPTVQDRAERAYSQMAEDLDRLSSDMLIVGDIETATWAAECAEIASHAFLAEREDPEPAR